MRTALGGYQIAYTNIGKDYTLANTGSREHYTTKPAVWAQQDSGSLHDICVSSATLKS